MPEQRYKTCVPLKAAAAGAFSDPQHIEDDGFEWVEIRSRHNGIVRLLQQYATGTNPEARAYARAILILLVGPRGSNPGHRD
jgi:hypothetical protein